MESSERDEGYISPLEVGFESRRIDSGISRRVYRRIGSCPSWDVRSVNSSKESSSQDPDSGYGHSYVTDIVESSGQVTDNLWLVVPEVQAHIIAGIPDRFLSGFPSTDAVEVLKNGEKPQHIPLEHFIRDTIDLLCGKQSQTFFLEEENNTFRKNPSILVRGLSPTALSKYCSQHLKTGHHVVKLSKVDEYFHFQTAVLASQARVCMAFVRFIQDFLKVYQVFVMVKRPTIKTLLGLSRVFRPFQQQINVLFNIVEEQSFASPCSLLNTLNHFMLNSDIPWASDLLKNLMVSCAAAYSRYVSDWIFRGELRSSLEFHILKSPAAAVRNRKFWTHQFIQNDEIPLFLPRFKNYMFDTGRVINLMKEINPRDLPLCFAHDSDLQIKLKLSHKGIEKLLESHRTKLMKFLQDYSYLQSGIENTVKSTTKSNITVDFTEVQRISAEYISKYETEKQKIFTKEKAVKQSRMTELLEEIQLERKKRVRRAMDELFEEKKADQIRADKEQQEIEKGLCLLEQYYGAAVSDYLKAGKKLRKEELPVGESILPEQKSCSARKYTKYPSSSEESEGDDDIFSEHNLEESLEPTPDTSLSLEDSEMLSVNDLGAGDSTDIVPIENEIPKLPRATSKGLFKLDFSMFETPLLPTDSSKHEDPIVEEDPVQECDSFLINRLLSLSVEIPVMTHHKTSNLVLLHHIIVTKQLFWHVKVLQDYFLLQNGLFGQFLCQRLIEQVQEGFLRTKADVPGQICTLNKYLNEILSVTAETDDIPKLQRLKFAVVTEECSSPGSKASSRASSATSGISKRKETITSDFDVLNSLCLSYTVDWPLNIFFTEEYFRKYASVFVLQMKLYRSEILLAKMADLLKFKAIKSSQVYELHNCRYVMLHFVRCLRSYINVTVIDTAWTELVSSFSKMDSVEKIYELLVQHIKNISSSCLLGPKGMSVMKLISSQLTVVEAFCTKVLQAAGKVNWSTGECILPKEFKFIIKIFKVFREIEKMFIKVAVKLADKGYYPLVEHFLELLNFNGFYVISD